MLLDPRAKGHLIKTPTLAIRGPFLSLWSWLSKRLPKHYKLLLLPCLPPSNGWNQNANSKDTMQFRWRDLRSLSLNWPQCFLAEDMIPLFQIWHTKFKGGKQSKILPGMILMNHKTTTISQYPKNMVVTSITNNSN